MEVCHFNQNIIELKVYDINGRYCHTRIISLSSINMRFDENYSSSFSYQRDGFTRIFLDTQEPIYITNNDFDNLYFHIFRRFHTPHKND